MAGDVLEENIYERKTKVMTADNEMNKSLIKGRKNGQKKKRAACLATLLKDKLNSDVVRFTPKSNLSCDKSGCEQVC